jgi:PAS domain S-box-containing protein
MSARLTDFITANRDEIIAVWADAVRTIPAARDLARPLLVDHIPDLLVRICEIANHVGASRKPSAPLDLAELHAGERLEEGFDLSQVVTEYRILRSCILRLWSRDNAAASQLADLQALDEAIDISIGASIDRYTRARDRTLRALDRIATEAFGSRNLDELLQRLLHVMKETTAAIDTAAILLREGDLLRVRAAVGLGREVERNMEVKVGEGFAGAVAVAAAEKTLAELSHVQIVSPILRTAGLTTLYGVPLIEDGEVIGVANMGSMTAHEFSTQDKRLFAAMTARATSAIRQQMLHEEAQARERELRTIADNIPQIAWMADATGARLWFNKRYLDYTGATLEETKGWGWQQFQHPAHVEEVTARYRRAFERGESWEDTFPLRGRDGHYRWFLSRAMPILDGNGRALHWFGTGTDVTETRMRDEMTAALTSTLDHDEMVKAIAQRAVPDFADLCAVDLVETEGLLRRAVVAHADPSKAELVRKLEQNYAPRWNTPGGVAQAIRTAQPVFAASVDEADLASVTAGERHAAILRELELTSFISAPLTVRGKTLGAITFATAGSGRRFRESDIEVAVELARRTAIGLEHARLYGEAHAASRLRETVLAIVSHELRTPLSTIDLAATMLLHGVTEPRLRKPAETIRRACERMDKMIGDLLDMAAIQSGRLRIELQATGALDLVREVVDLHEPLALEKGVKLVRGFDLTDDLELVCDRDRIQQVLSNLIGNAKKFGQMGDVIFVGARVKDGRAIFTVQDSGPGIAADELPHIFEPYWSGMHGKKQGTGLGLYIADAIVKAHGGELTVASTSGDGATFSFMIPIQSR